MKRFALLLVCVALAGCSAPQNEAIDILEERISELEEENQELHVKEKVEIEAPQPAPVQKQNTPTSVPVVPENDYADYKLTEEALRLMNNGYANAARLVYIPQSNVANEARQYLTRVDAMIKEMTVYRDIASERPLDNNEFARVDDLYNEWLGRTDRLLEVTREALREPSY